MLALWREFGLPEIFQQALQQGVILAGLSAGANCWFEACSTDALPGKLRVLSCMGFLRGSFCPHYDSEPARRPSFHEMIRSGQLMDGYAADDGAALHFIEGDLHKVIRSRPQAQVYRVIKTIDEHISEMIIARS